MFGHTHSPKWGRLDRGESLVTVLVALGLAGGLALLLMTQFKNAQQAKKHVDQGVDWAVVKGNIRSLLNSDAACKLTLGGATFNDVAFNLAIRDQAGTAKYSLNDSINGIRITALNGKSGPSSNNVYTFTVNFQGTKTNTNAAGRLVYNEKFYLTVAKNGAGTIDSCLSSADGSLTLLGTEQGSIPIDGNPAHNAVMMVQTPEPVGPSILRDVEANMWRDCLCGAAHPACLNYTTPPAPAAPITALGNKMQVTIKTTLEATAALAETEAVGALAQLIDETAGGTVVTYVPRAGDAPQSFIGVGRVLATLATPAPAAVSNSITTTNSSNVTSAAIWYDTVKGHQYRVQVIMQNQRCNDANPASATHYYRALMLTPEFFVSHYLKGPNVP